MLSYNITTSVVLGAKLEPRYLVRQLQKDKHITKQKVRI